jgi:hypothetical protein
LKIYQLTSSLGCGSYWGMVMGYGDKTGIARAQITGLKAIGIRLKIIYGT